MRQKIDPETLLSHMTMLEFQQFITLWTTRVEEETKQAQQQQNGNRLMKSLIAIRDILNYMTLKDS